MRYDMPELQYETDEELDRTISDWFAYLDLVTSVPSWFHHLHLQSWPRRPSLASILSAEPSNYSRKFQPEFWLAISSIWYDFCIQPMISFPRYPMCVENPNGVVALSSLGLKEMLTTVYHRAHGLAQVDAEVMGTLSDIIFDV